MFGVPFAPFEALPKNEKASLLFEERDESNLVLSSLKVNILKFWIIGNKFYQLGNWRNNDKD